MYLAHPTGYSIQTVAAAHRDPALEESAFQLAQGYPVNLDSPFPSVETIGSGRPQLIPEIPRQLIESVKEPTAQALLQRLDLRSALHVLSWPK